MKLNQNTLEILLKIQEMPKEMTIEMKRLLLIEFELFMFKRSKITNAMEIYKKIVHLQKADTLEVHVLYNNHRETIGLNI